MQVNWSLEYNTKMETVKELSEVAEKLSQPFVCLSMNSITDLILKSDDFKINYELTCGSRAAIMKILVEKFPVILRSALDSARKELELVVDELNDNTNRLYKKSKETMDNLDKMMGVK